MWECEVDLGCWRCNTLLASLRALAFGSPASPHANTDNSGPDMEKPVIDDTQRLTCCWKIYKRWHYNWQCIKALKFLLQMPLPLQLFQPHSAIWCFGHVNLCNTFSPISLLNPIPFSPFSFYASLAPEPTQPHRREWTKMFSVCSSKACSAPMS